MKKSLKIINNFSSIFVQFGDYKKDSHMPFHNPNSLWFFLGFLPTYIIILLITIRWFEGYWAIKEISEAFKKVKDSKAT